MATDKSICANVPKNVMVGLIFFICLSLFASCANTGRYNTQKGALAGAGVGAIAGQIIGGHTSSTLIGAGSGALIGAVIGNAQDQANQEAIDKSQSASHPGRVYNTHNNDHPPGRWVTVPGRWQGHHWVPEHRQWVPTHPE